jgi:PKD domain
MRALRHVMQAVVQGRTSAACMRILRADAWVLRMASGLRSMIDGSTTNGEDRMTKTSSRAWRTALALLAVCLWPLAALAQTWSWSTPNTYGAMLALDSADNVFVAASDPLGLTIQLSKTSRTGTKLWERTFDNPGTREAANWVAVDGLGNAIVAGRLVDTSNNPNGIVVLKFDTNGNLLWQDVIASPFAYGARVVADAAGNAYVLGRSWVANASGNTTHDIVTIKYGPDGTRLWQRTFGLSTLSIDSPASMALTPAGNLIVTGGTGGNMLALAYDPAGNTLWSKAIPASTAAMDVAVGPAGEFFLVGGLAGNTGTLQWLVVKHDAAFNELWRRTYALGPYATRAAVDRTGNLVATGITQPLGGYFNWMTAKLDPAGTLLWSQTYDQHAFNDEIPYALAMASDGAVYVTGQGGPAPVSALGDLSLLATVTVRYRADGSQDWARITSASVRGVAIQHGALGGQYVLGQSPQTLLAYSGGGFTTLNMPPTVVAAASPTSGTAPLAVNFSSAGTSDPDPFGGPLRLWWNFGDGRYSAEANPAHSYAVPGTYQATLTATDSVGAAVTSAPITITVGAPAALPSALTLASTSVAGGNSVRATVAVSTTTGVTVALASTIRPWPACRPAW